MEVYGNFDFVEILLIPEFLLTHSPTNK